jgi:hypothetical protein
MGAHTRRADGFSSRPATQNATPAPVRSERTSGPSQDQALYNCHCGYVFNALVSTTVGCPHCGNTQAW